MIFLCKKKRKHEQNAISNYCAEESVSDTDNFIVDNETVNNNDDLHYQNYEEYMNAQIHRKEPGKLLSEEEFYGKKQTIINTNTPKIKKNIKAKTKVNAAKKLTNQGKIFVAIYLIVVAIISCIILSVNTQRNDVMANALDNHEDVTPMAIVKEDKSNKDNVFDKLLDSITNK